MITKIEIDGFKTFRKFEMEFAPLTIIAGVNASGKSNLFDAMQLLSRIVETDLKTAFSEQRGDANELFTQYSQVDISHTIRFAVELLLDKNINDKFGGEATLKYTRLRYEVEVERILNDRGIDDLIIKSEALNTIRHQEDGWIKQHIINKTKKENWRPKVGAGRRGVGYIDTENSKISLRQDGKGGVKKEFAINNIYQAIISIVNSVDFPHALAAKEEISNWKFLQLNPEDLRLPSSYLAKDFLTHTGQNLAATLHRIKMQDDYALKNIERKLNSLLPSIQKVEVVDDKVGKQFVIKVKTQDGRDFTSRVLSEGTLRLLTLCVFLYDPSHKGILCFEEPENGIHPARMGMTAKLLEDLSTNFDTDNTDLRQVIINSHSPKLLTEIFANDNSNSKLIWFAELVTNNEEINNKRYKFQITKMSPVIKDINQLTIEFPESIRKLTLNKVTEFLQNGESEAIIKELSK